MKPLLPFAAVLSLLALVAAVGTAEPDTRVLVDKAVKDTGGADKLPGSFTFKYRVLIGETDTGFGAKRESVLDAPRNWWLKSRAATRGATRSRLHSSSGRGRCGR